MPADRRIQGFCCNYTASVSGEALRDAGLLPTGAVLERLPCTGRLEVPAILAAFEAGAEAVFVAGCRLDQCHNKTGSERAARRVKEAKVLLSELGISPDRLEMFFVGRGENEPVVAAAREMAARAARLGPVLPPAAGPEASEPQQAAAGKATAKKPAAKKAAAKKPAARKATTKKAAPKKAASGKAGAKKAAGKAKAKESTK
ncbi:hydrogenase iron-sulfur subunit [Dissulfurirhabdus thermomarina]|uniref:Hydrogenase iron-sulfur subunit n=1 Tax=Dissulfurirhabdus thermomarina TaxID=1765737 RepID=A0A6N9TVL1_DISTH|nr:hydrogenase iron-sulfur subunit [Dissulfurirhabdus thermomarina]NDY42526.1 hydrogenase iron-sulfur subunit [Dissulfurirhabdus thermomarina]NMX23515.1 hydrogenase iron-sulfur subunit [Dissulfurirhabdus thermomarina]